MLAVQRPMSKLPHHMLFGYSVDSSNSLYRLPSPPPLAPGPSLLDDTDTRFLDSFFDGVSSDQYLINDPNDAWNYDWQDLPPDFLGTTSSFGPQMEPVTNDVQHLTFPEFRNSLGFLPEQLSPSEDMISALRNGNNNHNNHQNNNHQPPHQNTHLNGHHSNAFMAPASRTQHMSPPFNTHGNGMIKPEQQQQQPPAPTQRKMSNRPEDYIRHASMSEAMYAPAPTSYAPHTLNKKKVEIKWGSDSGFNTGRRFVAPPNTITLDEIDESIISTLECLQPGSNVSTRASSPSGSRIPQAGERRLEMISEGGAPRDDVNEDGSERPKKRKKNKGKEGVYESDALELAQSQSQSQSTPNTKIPRKRRPKSFGTPTGSDTPNRASPPLHKRLKPTTGGGASLATPKMARENLTEDQKRENHIKSEQKRRTLIKEGFEDLNELVPELRGGGFSKSAVLIMAADWLEELVRRNEGLRGMVAELEARGGM